MTVHLMRPEAARSCWKTISPRFEERLFDRVCSSKRPTRSPIWSRASQKKTLSYTNQTGYRCRLIPLRPGDNHAQTYIPRHPARRRPLRRAQAETAPRRRQRTPRARPRSSHAAPVHPRPTPPHAPPRLGRGAAARIHRRARPLRQRIGGDHNSGDTTTTIPGTPIPGTQYKLPRPPSHISLSYSPSLSA